jgi:hypothetical protein
MPSDTPDDPDLGAFVCDRPALHEPSSPRSFDV